MLKTCESNANENVEKDTKSVRFDIIVRWGPIHGHQQGQPKAVALPRPCKVGQDQGPDSLSNRRDGHNPEQ